MRRILATIMMMGALLTPFVAGADHGQTHRRGEPSTRHSPIPQPIPSNTRIRVTPPENGTVTILQGESTLGQFGLPASLTVSSARTYEIVAKRGRKLLWRGSVQATGGTIEIAWGVSAAPTVRMIPPVVQTPAPPPVVPGTFFPPKPQGMKRGSFAALVALLESSGFESDKLRVVETAAQRNHFTVKQVGQILDTLWFNSDRVTVVKKLADRIVDPENAMLLAKHFDFSSDKQKVAAIFAR